MSKDSKVFLGSKAVAHTAPANRPSPYAECRVSGAVLESVPGAFQSPRSKKGAAVGLAKDQRLGEKDGAGDDARVRSSDDRQGGI